MTQIHPTAIIHTKAQIGEECQIGPYCVIGEHVVLGARCKLHSHVVLDGHTRLGQGNEIFPFASIGLKTQDLKWKGRMAMIGGCSKVVQDVPPFMLADGNPARTRTINKVGLERRGISEEAQTALKHAYKILFRDGLTMSNALAQIEAELPKLPEIQDLAHFVRRSERGMSK